MATEFGVRQMAHLGAYPFAVPHTRPASMFPAPVTAESGGDPADASLGAWEVVAAEVETVVVDPGHGLTRSGAV